MEKIQWNDILHRGDVLNGPTKESYTLRDLPLPPHDIIILHNLQIALLLSYLCSPKKCHILLFPLNNVDFMLTHGSI